MLFRAKERLLSLPGMTTRCITFGRGTRPLILIQGLNTRSIRGMALPLAVLYRIFAKDFAVYLFDRRENLGPCVTVRELAADVAAAMDALKIRQADVLGVSQGGMIAQYLAIDRPDLVRRLALAVTLCENNETVASAIRGWTGMAERGDRKTLVADMAEKMYSEAYLKRYRPMLPLLTLLQAPKDVPRFVTLANACLTCHTTDELHKIRCPVFVIGGARDAIVGPHSCTALAEKLHCRLHLYETLGHAAYEEAADFNRRVYDFFME